MREWHQEYADQGLVIIGNHAPEGQADRKLENLIAAVEQYEIEYAVAQDNDEKTWDAYQSYYCPTKFLIDKKGHIRYKYVGEGRLEATEAAIQALLAEEYAP